MLPTLCQPSQKLTSGWSGKIHSRFVSSWVLKDEPRFSVKDVVREAGVHLFPSHK